MAKRPFGPFVIGTAGHVDHGKTRLVFALTGAQTDRLAEERRRGVSIELGFAPWKTDAFEASIVDVPGHEDFVRTMVAGAGGIDILMLVVAADEGVMPQTREHAHICSLLGVRSAVVVLTKADRVDEESLELAREDVRTELEGTVFANAPIVATGVPAEGEASGLELLERTVTRLAKALPRRGADGPALLSIDRAFSVRGRGSVVTGTLLAGRVRVADRLRHLPLDAGRAEAATTVRGLNVRNAAVESIRAGERAAINLAELGLDALHRGDALCGGQRAVRSDALHLWAHHLAHGAKAWRSNASVLVCAGHVHAVARLDPLEPDELRPGAAGLVRVRLDRPIPAWRGLAVVFRQFEDDKAMLRFGRTIGGGTVIDPQPQAGRRLRHRWVALGNALRDPDPGTRALALIEDAGSRPISAVQVDRRTHDPGSSPFDPASLQGVIELDGGLLGPTALSRLAEQVGARVESQPGIAASAITIEDRSAPPAVVQRALALALADASLERDPRTDQVYPPGHGPLRRDALPPVLDAVMEAVHAGALTPPTTKELAQSLDLPPADIGRAVGRLARAGLLVRLDDSLALALPHRRDLLRSVATHFESHERLDLQQFKAIAGTSRKFAVPMLQHLDEIGATLRRRGEDHVRSRGPKLDALLSED